MTLVQGLEYVDLDHHVNYMHPFNSTWAQQSLPITVIS